jgi:hypothetical protein
VKTVKAIVDFLRGLPCTVAGHRWEQRQGRIAGFLCFSPSRCARCDVLAPKPFHTGSETCS